jgi:hypothetical protein
MCTVVKVALKQPEQRKEIHNFCSLSNFVIVINSVWAGNMSRLKNQEMRAKFWLKT